MKQGKIIKGIAGFYYVHVVGSGIYECKAKGVFRLQNKKPLVGDDVSISVISEEAKTGNIEDILERKNALIRPAVANVDQAVVVFALTSPKPNLNLLDRFLVMMEMQQVPAILALNKLDLASEEEVELIRQAYASSGYPVFFFSAKTGEGMELLRKQLLGKTSTMAGPSGCGKSTFINHLAPHAEMETGEVSKKIQRGRHTTRHAQLIAFDDDSYLCDTPGFSSLSVDFVSPNQASAKEEPLVDADTLDAYFPDFLPFIPQCRFRGCAHRNEPGCAVKSAVENGQISQSRYANYSQIFDELKAKKRY